MCETTNQIYIYICIIIYINPLKMVIFAINGNYQKDMSTYMVIQGKFMDVFLGIDGMTSDVMNGILWAVFLVVIT